MDYMNDMLARLQRGESVEALASELTNAINEANNKYQAELKAAEEAKRQEAAAEEAHRSKKIAAMDNLISAVVDLLAAYDIVSETLDAVKDTDSAELIDIIDAALPAVQEYMNLLEALEGSRKAPTGVCCKASTKKHDPIEDFLNRFVR